MTRRFWLSTATALAAETTANTAAKRQTSGDAAEPKWAERLTLSVGPAKADIAGASEKAIQAAVDAVARFGGGTVRILPGTYRFRNSVFLASNVRVVGSGLDSVIVKEPSVSVKLAEDSDWYDQEVTLAAGAEQLRLGDGICLRAKNPHNGGALVAKRTLVARNGNRFKLDRALRENFWLTGAPTAATLFPLFSAENIAGVAIENLTIDGNRANNENLDGNYSGCIWTQDCTRFTLRGVTARNNNGDGISWQVCHDFTVENCHSHGHAGLGLHPGSGSQRAIMRGNRLEQNDQGLFFCWGVKFGLAEKNTILGNRRYGISIGHRDTDNVIRDNDIRDSGEVGILFRQERGGEGYQPHRNVVERNRIVGVTKETGVGIDVQGPTRQITIRDNQIQQTQAGQRCGIRIGAEASLVTLAGNRIEGFATAIRDLRRPA